MTTIVAYFLAISSSAGLGVLCTYMYLQRKISDQIEILQDEWIANHDLGWNQGYQAALTELYENDEESTGRHGKKTAANTIATHARA